jgi:hypothetical protein
VDHALDVMAGPATLEPARPSAAVMTDLPPGIWPVAIIGGSGIQPDQRQFGAVSCEPD